MIIGKCGLPCPTAPHVDAFAFSRPSSRSAAGLFSDRKKAHVGEKPLQAAKIGQVARVDDVSASCGRRHYYCVDRRSIDDRERLPRKLGEFVVQSLDA